MSQPLILASGSAIRAQLLRNAAIDFTVEVASIDEDTIRASLEQEGASPRDIADTLAEMKARKISRRHPGALVLGCDQVLDFGGRVLGKPQSPEEALAQLTAMQGQRHALLSAAVVYENGEPLWRHVAEVRLTMDRRSPGWLSAYVARNWDSIRHSVGAYKLEEEGIRLFSRVEGDYFAVLGLPMLPLLSFLTIRGTLPS